MPFQTEEKNPDSGSLENDLRNVYQDMKKQSREVPIYVSFLRDGVLIERTRSAEALGEIGDKAAVQPLIDALSDTSTDVQYVAAKSLGMLADARAVDPLIGKLKSEEKWVRRGAAHALGLIGDKRAVDPLISLLSDPHHDVRAEAAWSLGQLGEVRAIGPLQGLLQDPREVVQKAAAAAVDLLKKIMNPAPEDQPAASVAAGTSTMAEKTGS